MPARALKAEYPKMYWTEAPQHVNFPNNLLRRKINSVVQASADKYPNFKILKMKKFWDAENTNLFRNNQFSGEGLAKYWSSVDAAFQYNETWRNPFKPKKLNQAQYHRPQEDKYNKYHWTVKGSRHQFHDNTLRFRLPKLPY